MNILLCCIAYIQRFLKIIDKSGKVVSFLLNEPQKRLYAVIKREWEVGRPVRIIILKARQMGFSTLTAAIIFWLAATAHAVRCMVVAHKDEATNNLFLMYKRFYENLPDPIKPSLLASNAKELVFDKPSRQGARGLDSRIRCATAGGQGVGRSYTLKAAHLSEVAFWPGDKKATLTGILQAVPDLPGTLVIMESTANGFEEFKNRWDMAVEGQRQGRDGYIPIFFAWHEMREYRRKVPKDFVRTQEEEELVQAYGLDDQQLAWRRWAIENLCGGDVDQFKQEYPASPEEAFISTGRCVFDKAAIVLHLNRVRSLPWERGMFRIQYDVFGKIEHFDWAPDPQGPIRIRKKPEPGVPYVLGGDTAGTGTDFFAGHVLDNRSGEQVAVLHHQLGERMFAEQAYCLGLWYNKALIGIEVNYSTYPEMLLEELGYPNLYVRQRFDNFTGKLVDAFGFETTTRTRPIIIDGLKDVARQALQTITDPDTLQEMLTFVYDDEWKPQAEEGEHDDLVMSLAIAHGIRGQQRTQVEQPAGGRKWTEDMWEDYNSAGPREREMMIAAWGQPSGKE